LVYSNKSLLYIKSSDGSYQMKLLSYSNSEITKDDVDFQWKTYQLEVQWDEFRIWPNFVEIESILFEWFVLLEILCFLQV
jgi:hypothetical protein